MKRTVYAVKWLP